MEVLPNPVKEAANLRKHRLDFSRVADILRGPRVEEPDDRPLGHGHEGRLRVFGVLDMRAVLLAYEPVEVAPGELAARPISLRYATRTEARLLWETMTR